jgi:Ca2+-binding EF-hand superfamily protein
MKKYVAALTAVSSLIATAHARAEAPSPTVTIVQPAAQRTEATAPAAPATAPATASSRLLAAADGDADGQVTLAELAGVVQREVSKRVTKRHAQLDRNRDGRISYAEVPKMSRARFVRFDINRDGNFTVSELGRVMTQEINGRLQTVLARLDTDGDQVCSVAELDAHWQPKRAATERTASAEPAARPAQQQAKAPAPTAAF